MPVTALLDTEIVVGQCLSDAEYQLHVQTTGRHDQKRCLGIRNKWGMWLHSTVDRVVIQTRASGVEHSAEEVRRKRFDAIVMKAARLHPMAFYFGAVLLLQRHDVFPLGFETSWLPGPMPEVAKDVAPCEAVEVTMALDGQSMEDDAFDVTAVAPTPEATKAFPAVRYRERVFEPLQIVHVLRRADGIQLDQPQCAVVICAPIASDGAYLVALEDGTSQHHVRAADMRAATASRGPARSGSVPSSPDSARGTSGAWGTRKLPSECKRNIPPNSKKSSLCRALKGSRWTPKMEVVFCYPGLFFIK